MKVQVFLKTPLFKGTYGKKRAQELTAAITEIEGTATARDGGLDVKVSALRDTKGNKVDPPFAQLFLPMAKIDYYVVLDAK